MYSENSEIEIIETLKLIFNYKELEIKVLTLQLKNCKIISEIDYIIKKFDEKLIYLTSVEAELILNIIKKLKVKKPHIYENIICSKVIDFWNMTQKGHGVGACYYDNSGVKPKTINESTNILKSNLHMFSFNFSKKKASLLL